MRNISACAWVVLLPAVIACSSEDSGNGSAGGATASGGRSGSGGSAKGGGQPSGGSGGSATGGTQSTGGTSATSGGQPSGGSGGSATGGTQSTGGQPTGGAGGSGGLAGGSGGQTVEFDPTQQPAETKAGMPYNPYPNGVVVTKTMHFDVSCWKIAAAGGTFYFENGETEGKSGFSSAFDQVGNDWIGNDNDKGYNTSPATGGKHNYRGWPNFGNGNFDHPTRPSGTSTRWVDEAGQDVPFTNVLTGHHLIMRSSNAKYELEYHFFPSHAAIKVLKADDKYAFLYEGPIGGEQEGKDKDSWVFKDGTKNGTMCGATSCVTPFVYFVDSDPKDTQVWYFGAKDTTEGVGGESYVQGQNMVVVDFGRPDDKRAFTGTNAMSVFGFYSKAADHATITSFIEARLADPLTEAPVAGVMP